MSYILNTLFVSSVAKYSSSNALEDLYGNKITYGNLQKKVNYCSEFLLGKKLGAGCRIGVLSSKNIDYVACIFSILSIKAAYVPLDCNSPINRTQKIIEDCNLHALFIETVQLTHFQNLIEQNHTFEIIKINEIITLFVFLLIIQTPFTLNFEAVFKYLT